MTKKVILDTDIGDDIDDALALLFLLTFEEADLIGVTTVFKNTPLRARLAKRILTLAGRGDVPVFAGHGTPFAWQPDETEKFVQYTPDLDEEVYRADNADEKDGEEAVDFIVKNAEKYGEALTLLAIGPYTNVAKAYRKAPEILSKCRLVLMGGCFYEQFVEYNVAMDPEACDILVKSDLSPTFVSADVTWQAQLNGAQTQKVLALQKEGGVAGYCAQLVGLWKQKCWFEPVLHDPLAVYYVIDDKICSTEEVWTEVELQGEHTRGMTVNKDHFVKYLQHKTPGVKRVLCTKTVDAETFVQIFLQRTFHIGSSQPEG